VLTALLCAGEAFYEHDWPREMVKYFLASSVCLLWWLIFVH
jgi:hypothetical protein